MSSLNITSQQIIDNRAFRKAAGLVGCISGRPEPQLDFFGYKDVQIWYVDANGHMNGDPGFDRMNPGCFCFDCRSAFDPKAEVDLQLILDGHERARSTYAQLLPAHALPPPETTLLMPSPSGGIAPPLLLRVDTSTPSYASFDEIPTSLPAPRARDILNETPDERLRADLSVLRGRLQRKLIVAMDRARHAVCYDDPTERATFLATVREDEQALWRKLDAVELLIKN